MNDQIRTWLIQRGKLEWNPKPIAEPKVDPDLKNLSSPQRIIESLLYFVRSMEFWISPEGEMREWLRVMCKLFIMVTCPIVIFMPTVTMALWQLSLWLAFMVAITRSLILLPIAGLAVITLCGVLVIVVRSLFSPR